MNKAGCQVFTARTARRVTPIPAPLHPPGRPADPAHPSRPPTRTPPIGVSAPIRTTLFLRAPIAQLVELRTFNPQVVGSSPTGGTEAGRPGLLRAPGLFSGVLRHHALAVPIRRLRRTRTLRRSGRNARSGARFDDYFRAITPSADGVIADLGDVSRRTQRVGPR